mmetsp:Transcript_5089/g.22047  ORF Transcript_5089/g.22047 Transcript_5089/m.22047 type:complete len:117 (-) Transcript_5089:1849-2199(-)
MVSIDGGLQRALHFETVAKLFTFYIPPDIGTHVVHHMFPQMPHYNIVEATEYIKPVLGEYYQKPERSGFLPFHLVRDMIKYVEAIAVPRARKTAEPLSHRTAPYVCDRVTRKWESF